MALSVVKYPVGYLVDPSATPVQPLLISAVGNILSTTHGLANNQIVYIYGGVSSLNGYWIVTVIDANNFTIKDYVGASVITLGGVAKILTDVFYYTVANVTGITTGAHGWNSVHLPIVYKLQSTLWPINGVDTARTITTFSNSNGYTYIVAAGDIKTTGTASSLEEVVLLGTSVDGIYKIINWYSDTNFVINLPYSAANVLSSGTVQYYYLNYHARIRIYAGLDAAHTYGLTKPYVLLTEQRCIPDSTGLITLNVADFVKDQIQIISNNLQENSLPNDIDSFCRIKISYAESYDDSNMYTVSELVGSYTDDTTEVYAINAKPQFKQRGSGAMNDWVWDYSGPNGTTKVAKFLTPFVNPILTPGKFFDIKYIKATEFGGEYMKTDLYRLTNGNYSLLSSTTATLSQKGIGVYRHIVTQSAALEDRIDLTITRLGTGNQLSEVKTIYVKAAADCHDTAALYLTWKNYLGGQDYWSFTAQKKYSIDILESKTQEQNIYTNWPNSYGEFADSIEKQTVRRSRNIVTVNSQFITKAQMDAIALIVTSPLVQIVTTNTVSGTIIPTLRTVIVDAQTVKKYQDRDMLYKISFNISYTDEIGVQEL
jgi:hypothetical protein